MLSHLAAAGLGKCLQGRGREEDTSPGGQKEMEDRASTPRQGQTSCFCLCQSPGEDEQWGSICSSPKPNSQHSYPEPDLNGGKQEKKHLHSSSGNNNKSSEEDPLASVYAGIQWKKNKTPWDLFSGGWRMWYLVVSLESPAFLLLWCSGHTALLTSLSRLQGAEFQKADHPCPLFFSFAECRSGA